MSRYYTKPKSWVADVLPAEDWITPDTPTVCDHDAVDTGLVDHRGDAIMRAPNPVGFKRDDEW